MTMAAYLDAWLEEAPDDVAGLARPWGKLPEAKGYDTVAERHGASAGRALLSGAQRDGNPSFRHSAEKVTKGLWACAFYAMPCL